MGVKRFAEHDANIDDVAFLAAVVEKVSDDYRIDHQRVFTMGSSNGGFMSQRLAIERSDMFAAAGIVIATLSDSLSKDFTPKRPVSMLFMNGTKDPIVPYDGGKITFNFLPLLSKRSRQQPDTGDPVIATDGAVNMWLKRNGLD